MPPTVYFNGSFLPKDQALLSPDDRGFLFADGIYEVARAYGGRFYALEEHLRRMAGGLSAIRISGFDAMAFGGVCKALLDRNGLAGRDAIVYMQVTRGAAVRTHAFPDPHVPPTVYATVQPFTPKVDPRVGVSVITAPDHRWTRCDIKSVALLPNCLAMQHAVEAGCDEAVLIRDGVALEGTHTSFFAVVDGEIRTAPANNYILPSITRAATLAICRDNSIPCRASPVFVEDLVTASELFLAGTTYEIMPIVRVDGRAVGGGRPGPVARRLFGLFRAHVDSASAG
jgi:D-alanine transaminase